MILNDIQIRDLCRENELINPYNPVLTRELLDGHKVISHGPSSYGYDVMLDREIKIFHNLKGGVVDPKRFNENQLLIDAEIMTDENGDEYAILPPNSYLLGRTAEFFKIPRYLQVICLGKSTYARCGALVNCTPIEAGFHGRVVIEIANGTPSPIKIYVNEGIAQFLFFQGEPCGVSYADRNGKYQGQTGVQLPLV